MPSFQQHRREIRRRPRLRNRSLRRGVAAVEFAIVAPIFFMLVVGIIEVGRAMMVQQVLINASRVGARQAVTLSSTQTSVVNAVTSYAQGVGVPGVSVTVSPDPATASAGQSITVNARINYASVSWLPAPWFMGGKQLQASSVMRKEGF
ncbi:MAG: pilus assembly protein TadE [Planctomycetota bacterium]|nr:MAG: pilus assembly protein TadE [Planctomycetota bacterium]